MSTTAVPEFGKIRSFLWPIHGFELRRFLPLFVVYALIVFNYSLLRAIKNPLVITAPNAGAESLVFIKVWAILPMAFFFTYLFTTYGAVTISELRDLRSRVEKYVVRS